MNMLVVYFSFSGNNRLLAEQLARRLNCDSCPIVETKRRTMLTIMLDMLFKRTPKIQPLPVAISKYARIILVAPIWGGKLANPMKTFIRREQVALSDYAFISLCGHGQPGQKEGITHELTMLAGRPPKAVAELRIRELFPAEKQEDIKAISSHHISNKDLERFEPEIKIFLDIICAG